MAQHDYNIANDSGLNFRADINAVLQAILSMNSGATDPTLTVTNMLWFDEANNIIKMRNTANDGWDTVLKLNATQALQLAVARTINGVSFNGTSNINIEDRKASNIASAATTTIGTIGIGEWLHITGTTNITSFGTSTTGVRRTLIFDGALTITHNAASLICVGSENIITSAGMTMEVVCENGVSGYWRVLSVYHPSLSVAELGFLEGVSSAVQGQINAKQATLVSGTNIKTINSTGLLGSGNIDIVANPSGVFANSQIFTASGTFTVPAGVTKVMVMGCGGGGGGGAASSSVGTYLATGGGGGGAESKVSIVNVTPSTQITVTVGAGGIGGAGANSSAAPGGNGGNSSFGSTILLGGYGGEGVNTNTAIKYGRGGSKAGAGGNGGSAYRGDNSSEYIGGSGSFGGGGGAGQFGNGASGGASNTAGSSAGVNTGAGGSGASNTTTTSGKSGGNGGSGKVIIYW